jgi:hypothetical protein
MSDPNTSSKLSQFLGIYRLVARLHHEAAWTKADNDAVESHFVRLQEAAIRGQVVLAGRTLESLERAFGIVVFEAAGELEARGFMDSDPTVVAGVMTYELHPYRVAVLR